MTRILVIEDDAHLGAGLRYSLERAGYEVRVAVDGPTGLVLIDEEEPDLVILDLMLPGIDGFDLLGRLRASGSTLPVIILSAQSTEDDQVKGFEIGANDYVGKPFGMRELLARVRARLPDPGPDEIEFPVGTGTARISTLEFVDGHRRVPLTPTEARLLRVLHDHAGEPMERRDLLRAVWGTNSSTTRTLDMHIRRLREKLEPEPGNPRFIRTVHGVGYRLDPS
ncbi:MAG: response regulator transcription factor [Planctomycetota bacterium]